MLNIFKRPNKESNYQGYMVFVLTILWSVVTGVIVSCGIYFFPAILSRWLTFIGVSVFIAITNLTILSLGHNRAASWSLTFMIWLYITIPCYSAGGIMAPGIISQMSVILTAGFLLGWRGGLACGLLTMGVDFMFAYLEITGQLPHPTVVHNPITRWIGAIIPFGTILALQYYATNHLRTSLEATQREITKRKDAENLKDNTLHALEERVKELSTLYAVSRFLQMEDIAADVIFKEIVQLLPSGWQYPEITEARIFVSGKEYSTANFRQSDYLLRSEMKTANGVSVSVEVVYLIYKPEVDEGPFLKEERNLINMLAEMLKIYLERKEKTTELRDYKFALDMAAIVSISGADGRFTFVNENFCKVSKYTSAELIHSNHNIIWSGYHSPDYFDELSAAMNHGKPYSGAFCNKAKDGSLYWVQTTIVPFLDEHGEVYQYLSINHDITERKEANDKIKKSEQLLRKITSQVPGNTYMFEIFEDGNNKMLFMNRGTDLFNHNFRFEDISNNPQKLREILHEEDKTKFEDAMKEAYSTGNMMSFQYRIVINGVDRWRWMQAVPEIEENGRTIWYGSTSDITPLVDYLTSIEQILFDIAHVIRRPISTMLGMTKLITDNQLTEKEIKEYSGFLYTIAVEMDEFIRELNRVYQEKKEHTQFNIDVSSTIDKRNSLFS